MFCHTLYIYFGISLSTGLYFAWKPILFPVIKCDYFSILSLDRANTRNCWCVSKIVHFSWYHPVCFLTHPVYQPEINPYRFYGALAFRKCILLLVWDAYFLRYFTYKQKGVQIIKWSACNANVYHLATHDHTHARVKLF